jgi:predicted permease
MFYTIIYAIITLSLLMSLGYFLKYFNILKEENAKPLSEIVFYIALPCLIFIGLSTTNLKSLFNVQMTIIAIAAGLITALIAFGLYTLFKIKGKKRTSLVIPITFGQSTFMGMVILVNFSHLDSSIVMFFDIGSYIVIFLLNIFLMLTYADEKTLSQKLKKILTFPIMWAVVLGLIVGIFDINIGPILNKSLTYLSAITIPIIWVVLGLSLDFKAIKENLHLMLSTALIKLLLFPLLAIGLIVLLHVGGLNREITILDALVPCGIVNIVLANDYNLDTKLVAGCIFISTILSFITIPILATFL